MSFHYLLASMISIENSVVSVLFLIWKQSDSFLWLIFRFIFVLAFWIFTWYIHQELWKICYLQFIFKLIQLSCQVSWILVEDRILPGQRQRALLFTALPLARLLVSCQFPEPQFPDREAECQVAPAYSVGCISGERHCVKGTWDFIAVPLLHWNIQKNLSLL